MARLPRKYYFLILLALLIALSGCELRRTDDSVSDLEPVDELAPTLVPLGSDSEAVTGEATVIPTVINVQPTATGSLQEEGGAAPDPEEPAVPTSQPAVDLADSAENANSEAEAASVSPETFTAPAVEAVPEEAPVITDATGETLPEGGPIAASPPASETGDFSAPAYGEGNYTVQPGDTLFSIGQRYGVTALAIMSANGLSSDVIQAGQVLAIPAEGAGSYAQPSYDYSAPTGGGGTHTVAPGETLFRIAQTYGTSVEAIAGANGIPYPYVIQVGQDLVVPAPGSNPGPPPPPADGFYPPSDQGYYPQEPNSPYDQGYYPPGEPNNGYYPAPAPNYPPPGGANTHTVAPGETLFSIAQRYGLAAEAIVMANGLANPNQIYVGQVLYLP
jgi:LysM repeat protein